MKKGASDPKTLIQCAFVGPMPIILLRMSIFFQGELTNLIKNLVKEIKVGVTHEKMGK